MNKKIFVNIIPLLVAFIMYNCNSSSDPKKMDVKDGGTKKTISFNPYFPADEGNKWEYVNDTPGEETEKFVVEMKSVKESGDYKIVELSSFPFFSRTNMKMTLRISKDGEVKLIPNGNDSEDSIMIPSLNNLKLGYVWMCGGFDAEIGSLTDSANTRVGKYDNCLYLNYALSITLSVQIWLAKDIGIVKWGVNRTNPPTFKMVYFVLQNMTLSK